MPSNITISISDDAPDLTGNMRLVRRRRKKFEFRTKNEILRRILTPPRCRRLMILVFVPVLICLLLFEISVLTSGKVKEVPKSNVNHRVIKEVPPNLNSLKPVTRVIGGKRQPCLKILSPEEIQKLVFPASVEPSFPVRRVEYKSDSGNYHTEGNATILSHLVETTRFNLFTGNQTFEEREESFEVTETAVVHCGFYSEHGGFKISDDDKTYMQSCKAVVSTCAFGGGDDLYQPIGMTEASLEKICYVAFWDEITRAAQEAEGARMSDDHMIGKWRIVVVKDLPFSDQRLNGKIPKMLSHRLFPQAKYSIWVDSKSQFRRDPLGVLEALLWRTNSVLAISEHGARSSLYDEARAVIKKHKASPEEVEVQLNQYHRDGIPDDKRFNGKKALSEASVIVREHTPSTNLLMCLWFNEVVRFTSRDQLSFPYVLRRLNMPGINMFPVCTRKDLVNSMGHRRKVKPLV